LPEEKRPDVRPQLREFLAWYEEVLGRIEAGAVVAPGEQERLTEEASASSILSEGPRIGGSLSSRAVGVVALLLNVAVCVAGVAVALFLRW
jgi:hypothetical protein